MATHAAQISSSRPDLPAHSVIAPRLSPFPLPLLYAVAVEGALTGDNNLEMEGMTFSGPPSAGWVIGGVHNQRTSCRLHATYTAHVYKVERLLRALYDATK